LSTKAEFKEKGNYFSKQRALAEMKVMIPFTYLFPRTQMVTLAELIHKSGCEFCLRVFLLVCLPWQLSATPVPLVCIRLHFVTPKCLLMATYCVLTACHD
jgi:hypothetical protein